jgi:hypothetical protein
LFRTPPFFAIFTLTALLVSYLYRSLEPSVMEAFASCVQTEMLSSSPACRQVKSIGGLSMVGFIAAMVEASGGPRRCGSNMTLFSEVTDMAGGGLRTLAQLQRCATCLYLLQPPRLSDVTPAIRRDQTWICACDETGFVASHAHAR